MHLFSPEHISKITWSLNYLILHIQIFSTIINFLNVYVTLKSEIAELTFEVTFENE